MFRHSSSVFLGFLLMIVLIFPQTSEAQESSWAGKMIVLKKRVKIGYKDNDGNQKAISEDFHPIQTVLKEKDGRLQLRYKGIEGWFDKGDAVLLEGAVSFFTDRIRMEPKEPEWYNLRGETWNQQKKHKNALKDFNEAIRLQSKEGVFYANRGNAFFYLKEFRKAISDFNEAIRLRPFQSVYYSNRGSAYSKLKEYDKAIADYNEAIRRYPNEPGYYWNRGSVYSELKEYDKAIADHSEAIRLDPNDPKSYSIRGSNYLVRREYRKAIADYNKAIKLNPKEFSAYNGRAWVWATCPDEKLRNGKKAVESAKRACELTKWKDLGLMDTLAAAYAEAGDFENAVKYQTQALEDPDFAKDEGFHKRLELYKKEKPYRE